MKTTNKLTTIVAAALLSIGCSRDQPTRKPASAGDYSHYSQFKRKPEKVQTSDWGEVILLHDLTVSLVFLCNWVFARTQILWGAVDVKCLW